MLIDFTLANYGPFREPVMLTFEAANDKHLESSYVRSFTFANGKPMRLLRAAIIYGPNGAGKSSVLEALSLMDDLVTEGRRQTDTPLDVNGFAFQKDAEKQATQLTVRFLVVEQIYRYTVHVTKDAVQFEKLELLNTPPDGTRYTTLFERKMGALREEFYVDFPSKKVILTSEQHNKLNAELQPNTTVLYTLNRKMTLNVEEIKQAFTFFKAQLMGEVHPKKDLEQWVTMRIDEQTEVANFVLKQLNRAGIPIQGIDIQPKPLGKFEVDLIQQADSDEQKELLSKIFKSRKQVYTQYVLGDASYQLRLDQESLGTQRYYTYAGLLNVLCDGVNASKAKGRVLPLDEMEHSLHPELLEYFWLTFLRHEGNSQIITTSHYREFLQDRTIFRDDVIWFVDKDPATLSSSLYALEDVKTDAGLRATSSVYNYYVSGRLGATPQISRQDD